jgi:hypothetical protein
MKWTCFSGVSMAGALFLTPCLTVAQPDAVVPWTYTLTAESSLTDDCPVCDRLPIVEPLRGTFQLRLLEEGPLFSTYSIEAISLKAGRNAGRTYDVTGKGTFRIGGEVALVQEVFLEVEIGNGATTNLCYLTNSSVRPVRGWPMMRFDAIQTNGTMTQQYSFEIAAAPFREIWFSTTKGFNSQLWNPPTNWISSGDILSQTGRVVKRNYELVGGLGFMPVVPDLGVKDFDVMPGGEIGFSLEQGQFSETLGMLSTGDLLSDQGKVLKRWETLLAPLSPDPLLVPVGLGAVQVRDDGEIYFSAQNNFFSSKLGAPVSSTDLLSDAGTVIEKGDQLLGAFGLKDPSLDCGLAAVFVWPSPIQESWFFVQKGFYDSSSNYFAAGDLLSDLGYVVYRSSELLFEFAPLGTTAGLPMDGLFVVAENRSAHSTPDSKLSQPAATNQPPSSLVLSWSSKGRVFQLEKSDSAAGPFVPVSPITTDRQFTDSGTLTNLSGFYRLRTW